MPIEGDAFVLKTNKEKMIIVVCSECCSGQKCVFYETDLLIGTMFNCFFTELFVNELSCFFFLMFRYQVRTLKGAFQRAYGIHVGAALVKVCCLKKSVLPDGFLSRCILKCYVVSRGPLLRVLTLATLCAERVIKHPSWRPLRSGGGRGVKVYFANTAATRRSRPV